MSVTTAPSRAGIEQQLRARRIANQTSRISVIVLGIITSLVLIFSLGQGLLWLQSGTFPGFFVKYPNIVDYAGAELFFGANPQAARPPIAQNERLLAVEGSPITTGRQFQRALNDYTAGDSITLTVRGVDGEVRSETITLSSMPRPVYVVFVVTIIASLLYLVFGLWVANQRRDQPVGRIFLMFCLAGALMLATILDLWTAQNLVHFWALSVPLMGALLVSLALIFPAELPMLTNNPGLRFAPAIVMMPVIVLGQIRALVPSISTGTRTWVVEFIFGGLCIALVLGIFLSRSLIARSPTVREQSRVILAGALLAFTPFLFFVVDPSPIRQGWVILTLLIFPLTIAYTIVQYNTLDTSRIVNFSATHGIMLVVTTLAFALLVWGVNLIANAAIPDIVSNPIVIGVFTFLLVFAFQPVRQRLQRTIDGLFFRTQAEYESRLTAFRQQLTVAAGLSDVVRLLKSQIRETLMPTHIYVFLRDIQGTDFVAHGEGSRPDTDIRFEQGSGLVHALSTTRDVLFLEYNKPMPPELIEEHARLAVLRTPILAPLQGQERLTGWVAVGQRRSGDRYSMADLRFVQALAEQASLAVERAQVISDLERRVRELDVLSQVSQAVNFTTDPDVLLELIYTQTGKLIDTTNFYIIMHRPDVKALYYAFFLEGHERYEEQENLAWRENIGLEGEIVRAGRPIRTEDYLAECARRNIQPRPDSKHYAWMGVPLNAGNTTLGAMVVASFTPGVFYTDDQLKVFWDIANQAATALDKARLFRETELRALQLQTLNEISNELSSELDLENLLGAIMSSAVDILNTEAGSLFLVDEETGDLIFRVVEGGAQNLVGERVGRGKGIVGQAATRREPVIVNNVSEDQNWFRNVDEQTAFRTESILAVPLLIHDEAIGVLEVINRRDGSPFSQDDVSLLTTFAAQAAVAIDNARLYEATDAALAARVDELQNLQRIDRELNRTLNFDRVLNITLDWALRTTGASAGMIAMLSPEDETMLEIPAAAGYKDTFLEGTSGGFPATTGIAGRVMHSGKPEFIRDVTSDPDFVDVAAQPTVTQITVPILRANQPIGVLIIESHIKELLTTNDFEFIQRLVEHAAVAIENARLVQGIEQANRDKTEFIGFVAHELKNPMTSIRGYTDLLRNGQMGEISDMQKQFLTTIRSNVDRMKRIVDDLRDVARIETNQLKLEKTFIEVEPAVEETLRSLQGQIEEKNQTLVLNIDDGLPKVYADNVRLVQILTNLISNAHKYTPEDGEIRISVSRHTVEQGQDEPVDAVLYAVEDTGIGMSQEDLSQLFQKFFRADRGKEMAKGTGLGLVITRDLVRRHGGDIWVESEVGIGTTFYFYVPIIEEPTEEEEEPAI